MTSWFYEIHLENQSWHLGLWSSKWCHMLGVTHWVEDTLASAWVIETLTAKKQWSLEMSVGENWAIVTCWSQSHFFPLFPTIPHWNSIHPSCYLKWALGLLQEGLSSPGDLRWLLQSRAMAPLSASTQSSHTGHRAKIKSLLFKSESKTYFSMAGSSRTG